VNEPSSIDESRDEENLAASQDTTDRRFRAGALTLAFGALLVSSAGFIVRAGVRRTAHPVEPSSPGGDSAGASARAKPAPGVPAASGRAESAPPPEALTDVVKKAVRPARRAHPSQTPASPPPAPDDDFLRERR
jgi:hypothetical protein